MAIDIKPDSEKNKFNPDEKGVLPVAILGSNTLDVKNILLDSLQLQSLTVKIKGKRDVKYAAHYEDINADHIIDLVVKFQDSDKWEQIEGDYAILTGKLANGMIIEGMDIIKITKKK